MKLFKLPVGVAILFQVLSTTSGQQLESSGAESLHVSESAPIFSGWTPMNSRLNSQYQAINPAPPTPSVSPSNSGPKTVPSFAAFYQQQKLTKPIAAKLANITFNGNETITLNNVNTTYIGAESKTFEKKLMNRYKAVNPSKLSIRNSKLSSKRVRSGSRTSALNDPEVKISNPSIKPHRHGATLGFNLPDQGLTLYLDINELATKPMAQNIGLKVVAHKKTSSEEESNDISNERIVNKKTKKSKRKVVKDGAKTKVIDIPSSNVEIAIDTKKIFNEKKMNDKRSDIPPTASRIPATYVSQVEFKEDDEMDSEKTILSKTTEKPTEDTTVTKSAEESSNNEADTADSTEETTNDDESKELEREAKHVANHKDDQESRETESSFENEDTPTIEEISSSEEEGGEIEHSTSTSVPPTADDHVTTTVPVEMTTAQPSGVQDSITTTTSTENSVTTTQTPEKITTSGENIQAQVAQQERVDNQLVREVREMLDKSTKLFKSNSDQCTKSCQVTCMPSTRPQTSNTSTTIREIAQQLQAENIFNQIGNGFEGDLQDIVDFSTGGYTILLPSNSAIEKIIPSLFRKWKSIGDGPLVDAYVIEGRHTIKQLSGRISVDSRNRASKLFINSPQNRSYTINGQRVVIADQSAPNGGIVHVIDGLIFPYADKDIIETLKSCGKLDGFVTLAEGTGFSDVLRKEGPFTVFVPSNDALQKVPDNDLETIRRNMTALREFLKYHVAMGVYHSQDLIDGQFMPSLMDGEYLQAGVRVDGCSRRLVEVNVSPLYRADIPASNGIIHIVDWILKPDDRDWCNGVTLPKKRR